MKINKDIANKIVRLRYGRDDDETITIDNVRKHFSHREMTRSCGDISTALKFRHKINLSSKQISSFLAKRLSVFRSLDFDGQKISRYAKYNKSNKVWLKSRKICYLYWYLFLQLAELDKKRKVNWSKYKGWGGKEEILKKYPKRNFNEWFEERGMKLFAVKKPTDKALFEPTTYPALDAIYFSYETYRLQLDNPKMTNEQIFKSLRKRKTQMVEGLDNLKIHSGEGNNKYDNLGIYKKRYASILLDNVCKGIFPGKLDPYTKSQKKK